jgi:hypothetical protein
MGGKDLPSGNCPRIITLRQLLLFKERRRLAGGIHVSHRILQCHESYRKAILLIHIGLHKTCLRTYHNRRGRPPGRERISQPRKQVAATPTINAIEHTGLQLLVHEILGFLLITFGQRPDWLARGWGIIRRNQFFPGERAGFAQMRCIRYSRNAPSESALCTRRPEPFWQCTLRSSNTTFAAIIKFSLCDQS